MILRLSLWKDYRERNLISFSFLHMIEVYVFAIATCYLIHSENLGSSYKYSNVWLICSSCVKRKQFVSVKSTTRTVPGYLKEIYICLMLMYVTVDSI